MDQQALVVLCTLHDAAEAQLVADLLRSEGIDVAMQKDDAGGLYPNLTAARGIHLLVRSEDKQRGEDLLSRLD